MAPDVSEEAKPVFFECLAEVKGQLPDGIDYGDWRRLSKIALEDRYSHVWGVLTENDERRDDWLQAEHRLTNAYLLVKHLDECRPHADEIIFYQRVRKQLLKSMPGKKGEGDLDRAVRDLVDDTVKSEGVVDIFKAAGIEKPDLSILDDNFLQTFKDKPLENLRLKLLEKLMRDEILRRTRTNLAKSKSFKEMLEKTLQNYHNRLIDAAAVIKAMIQIRREMQEDDRRTGELGLEEDELAFYDALSANLGQIYEIAFLRDVVHDVVQTIKKNLRVDWTEPHRDDVKASVRTAVKRVLRTRNVEAGDFDAVVTRIMEQAEALYRDWPLAA